MIKPTVIVTGGTGAIGKAIARQLAVKDYNVTIIARDVIKARDTVKAIIDVSGNPDVDYLLADLSQKQEIEKAAQKWGGPLHVLINNASTTPPRREETADGIEMQFAVNVLGYFRMIKSFLPFLKMEPSSRIINVASYWAGDLDLNDPEFKQRHYDNNTAYRQSKQMERMLTVAFAKRLKEFGITVNAAHPGEVSSRLANNLGFGGHESPDQGADTPVWLATAKEVENVTGKYFEHGREAICRFGRDEEMVEKVYALCEKYG
jgi:NAD(P)-dependent dehydrogenase (short-subunit alcohol dehydrogenase family)